MHLRCACNFLFTFAFEHESSEYVHLVCVRVYMTSVNAQICVTDALQSKMTHYNHR